MKDAYPYSYRAFGLHVCSAIPLPELPEQVDPVDPVDVFVRRDALARFAPEVDEAPPGSYSRADRALLRLDGVGRFLVRDGSEIVVEPEPGVSDETLRMGILGLALGMVLHQRGALLLHASAVEVSGGTVAFMGDKGQGKSTLAAALHARGHRLVTDDVLAISVTPGGALAYPSFPQIKLWPESVSAALGGDPAALPRVHGALEKRRWGADAGFSDAPLPLRGLYVLEVGSTVAVEPMPRVQALDRLIRNAYLLPFIRPMKTEQRLFRQCAAVAESVPVARLVRRVDLEGLELLADAVVEHAGGTG